MIYINVLTHSLSIYLIRSGGSGIVIRGCAPVVRAPSKVVCPLGLVVPRGPAGAARLQEHKFTLS